MSLLPNSILPKNFKRTEGSIRVSPRLSRIAAGDQADVFAELQTGQNGLVEAEGRSRLDEYGPSAVGVEQRFTRLKLLIKACLNPLVILLRGVTNFTWPMLCFTGVIVLAVFLINGCAKHDWGEAFLFALAEAVGLTPEMINYFS